MQAGDRRGAGPLDLLEVAAQPLRRETLPDVPHAHPAQRTAVVAGGIHGILVHVHNAAVLLDDVDRVGRPLDQAAEALFALAQLRLRLLALRHVTHPGDDAPLALHVHRRSGDLGRQRGAVFGDAGEPIGPAHAVVQHAAGELLELAHLVRMDGGDRQRQELLACVAEQLAGPRIDLQDRATHGLDDEQSVMRVLEEAAQALLALAQYLLGPLQHLARFARRLELHLEDLELREELLSALASDLGRLVRGWLTPPSVTI